MYICVEVSNHTHSLLYVQWNGSSPYYLDSYVDYADQSEYQVLYSMINKPEANNVLCNAQVVSSCSLAGKDSDPIHNTITTTIIISSPKRKEGKERKGKDTNHRTPWRALKMDIFSS